jgi:transcriptional regulator with XRE-family HTH domain
MRMRRRREVLGISQGRLGRHLGLNFSQIQKFEKGANRIGAGRLFLIAACLRVAPGSFFEGIASEQEVPDDPALPPQSTQEEEHALLEAFRGIGDPDARTSVLALVRSLTDSTAARRTPD